MKQQHRFKTSTCTMCREGIDRSVAPIEEEIPGAVLVKRFCSRRCRRDYQAWMNRDDVPSSAEQIAAKLHKAGITPESFDHGLTGRGGD